MPVSRTHRPVIFATATLFGLAALAVPPREARAADVSPTGKGMVGGGLLGAEVVTIVESIAGVKSPWAYVIGGVVGAGGGAVGGYFVEQSSTDGRAPMYMLAGGLALVIPAVVLTLNATRWQPEEGATEDRTPAGPPAEPGAPGGSITGAPAAGPAAPTTPASASPPAAAPSPASAPPATPPAPAPAPPPQSLLDVHEGAFRLGVPLPDVLPVFSLAEQRQYGLKQATELRMPVLHVTF
jgi:hypothetical protein